MATATIYLALALCCAIEALHFNFNPTSSSQYFLDEPSLHLSGPGAAFAKVVAFRPTPARLPVNGFGWEKTKHINIFKDIYFKIFFDLLQFQQSKLECKGTAVKKLLLTYMLLLSFETISVLLWEHKLKWNVKCVKLFSCIV